MKRRFLALLVLALLSGSCESLHARGFADAFAKDAVPEVCTACDAADATEEAADLTETEEVATTAPDGAQDTTAIAAPGLTIGLVADMRYFAAPEKCLAEFAAAATVPVLQDTVSLSSSSDGWPASVAEGAIPLRLDGDRWTLTREFTATETVEYKFLMKWPDTAQQWCNSALDCSPGAANDSQLVDCDALRRDTSDLFRGAAEKLAELGPVDFVISPGDIDPPANVLSTLQRYTDPAIVWYPVAGNHETETPEDIQWLRDYNPVSNPLPNIVAMGPPGGEETSYSFDVQNAHFVVLNEYYDGSTDAALKGDVSDALYDWLAADLAKTTKEYVFVAGHEPGFPLADVDSGRIRHAEGCLNKNPETRDRFWALLAERHVVAYLCGHTHNFSAEEIDGVWQIDTGHARGKGDTGSPSTVVLLKIAPSGVTVEAHRDNHDGVYDYADLVHTYTLVP